MKKYEVIIEFDDFIVEVKAKNKAEAKQKALEKLKKKSILSLIARKFNFNPTKLKKAIEAEEID